MTSVTARTPIGQAWLLDVLDLPVPPPHTFSYVRNGARRTERIDGRTIESYPPQYAVEDRPVAHLKFALRREPYDLGVVIAALERLDPREWIAWHEAEPTGKYFRRAWFFYETFVGVRLDLPDAKVGNYVPALDPERHIVAGGRNSRRHRVVDNLLGGPDLCPTVRRTPSTRPIWSA